MVRGAATADGVLLQVAQAGRGLASVQDRGAGACQRGDAAGRHRWRSPRGGASRLSAVLSPDRMARLGPAMLGDLRRDAGHGLAVGHGGGDDHALVQRGEDGGHDAAGRTPRPAPSAAGPPGTSRPARRAPRSWDRRRARSSARAAATTRATAAGSGGAILRRSGGESARSRRRVGGQIHCSRTSSCPGRRTKWPSNSRLVGGRVDTVVHAAALAAGQGESCHERGHGVRAGGQQRASSAGSRITPACRQT